MPAERDLFPSALREVGDDRGLVEGETTRTKEGSPVEDNSSTALLLVSALSEGAGQVLSGSALADAEGGLECKKEGGTELEEGPALREAGEGGDNITVKKGISFHSTPFKVTPQGQSSPMHSNYSLEYHIPVCQHS